MIINTLNTNKVKILIDEVDLKNAGIPPENLISNAKDTLSNIEKLLKYNTSSLAKLPEELVLKDYFIFTYNFKIFSIILFI